MRAPLLRALNCNSLMVRRLTPSRFKKPVFLCAVDDVDGPDASMCSVVERARGVRGSLAHGLRRTLYSVRSVLVYPSCKRRKQQLRPLLTHTAYHNFGANLKPVRRKPKIS